MISTVVVTYNKLSLLKECLNAILNQTCLPDTIIVVNNNSTDGTKEYLDELSKENSKISPIHLSENIGGAGGFNSGIKQAMAVHSDYIWIMDDDTIPSSTALEELVTAKDDLKGEFSFLASNVRWIDGSPCLMNIPKVLQNWNSIENYVELEFSSFVSMFVNAEIVKKVGYPITEFFIWGDDVEYAHRLGKIKPGYYVDKSVVLHKMNENKRTDILKDHESRLPRYYYAVRNGLYQARQNGKKDVVKYVIFSYLWLNLRIIFTKNDHKLKKLSILNKGFFSGLTFNPLIEQYKDDSND